MEDESFLSKANEIKSRLIRIRWSKLIPIADIFNYELDGIGIHEYVTVHNKITSIVFIGQTKNSFLSRLYQHKYLEHFPIATHIRIGVLKYYHPLFPVWTRFDYERCLYETESLLIRKHSPIYNNTYSPVHTNQFDLKVEDSADNYYPNIKQVN